MKTKISELETDTQDQINGRLNITEEKIRACEDSNKSILS